MEASKEREKMKKQLLITLVMGLILAFALGCSSEEPILAEEEEVPAAAAPISEAIQQFVDIQNDLFASMPDDELAVAVTAEGTVIRYTYTFVSEDLYEEVHESFFENATAEGEMLLAIAQETAPEITAIIIEFVDTEGSILDSAEFN